jgi:hypothetical protein
MSEPWLTKRELAAELKVSVRTIERLHLPALRVGAQNRYLRSEAERFLRGHVQVQDNVIDLRPEVVA